MQAIPSRRALGGLGIRLLESGRGAWRGLRFAGDALVAALSPSTYTAAVRGAAARQLCVSAWQVLPGVVAFCALLGYVVIRIVSSTAHEYGLSAYAVDVFVRVLVLELIPLFVALFVALRSGAALGTEVALMRVSRENPVRTGARALRAELLPRGIGNAVAVLCLTAVGAVVALAVAYVGLYGFSPWGHDAYSRAIGQVFEPLLLAGFALKVTLFALAVGAIPVAAGLSAARDWPGVPQAAPAGSFASTSSWRWS
ncbi:MAG: MlaE family ABC transporter permease, partial [Burkholderiales bacterium]